MSYFILREYLILTYQIINTTMNKLSEMREFYERAELDEKTVDSDPIKQFDLWFEEAIKEEILEPNAMTLSTVDIENNPTSRIVLLKGVEERGFVFYTNYESDKGKDIERNPNVSLLFLWKKLQRQVRISGIVEKLPKEQSEDYFHSRPKGSQIGAWVSPQSKVISDKEVLARRKEELVKKYKDDKHLPLPDFWGGYKVTPNKIEFWQGRPDRLHDRLRYTINGNTWKLERIAP
jgi:pyridoxamine 5'-phosphate oxidase